MTTQLRNPTLVRSAFSGWLRNEPGLDSRKYSLAATDIDDVIHQYMVNGSRGTQNIMLIEEKCYMAEMPFSQRDTLHIIDCALRAISGTYQPSLTGQKRLIRYHGLHLLQFENTSPDDGKIFWDKKEVSREELIAILRFERLRKQ